MHPRFVGPGRCLAASTGAGRVVVMLAALASAAPALGQQFVEQQTTRFPQPALLEYTNQLTIGDLDGDTDLDLVFANGGNFMSAGAPQMLRIFINNGAGVFTDETVARTGGLTFLARGAELGDIERDGDLDIIVAQDFNRQPTLLVNDGQGVFSNQTATRVPTGVFGSSRGQFADVDNDGDLDIYLTNGGASRWGAGRGKLWLNDFAQGGTGVFTDVTATNTPDQTVTEPQDCIFGDIDGDFDLDLRIGSTAPNHSKLYRNDGSGVFTHVTVPAVPADNNCYSYDFGDLNGDGDLDLIGANGAASGTNAEIQLNNDGTGGFTLGPFTGATSDDNDSKFLDYDNDGDLDLFIARIAGPERAYSNDGSGNFALASGIMTAVTDSSLDIKVADLDGDGRYDIVTGQGESGSFINRIYMNLTGPVDTIAPGIVRTEVPANAGGAGPFVVRTVIYDAHTSDRGFHDKGVYLNWRSGDTGPFAALAMPWSGNSVWRGVIPAQKTSGTIEYFITAIDFANNLATGATLSFEALAPCPSDIASKGTSERVVDIDDLLMVISAWGPCPAPPAPCPADIAQGGGSAGVIDIDDLLAVISAWGPCP